MVNNVCWDIGDVKIIAKNAVGQWNLDEHFF